MTKQESIDFAALQDRLAAEEAECRQLRKELHDIRSYAQVLQNKLAVVQLQYEDLLALVKGTGPTEVRLKVFILNAKRDSF
jgi:hypothetical protein